VKKHTTTGFKNNLYLLENSWFYVCVLRKEREGLNIWQKLVYKKCTCAHTHAYTCTQNGLRCCFRVQRPKHDGHLFSDKSYSNWLLIMDPKHNILTHYLLLKTLEVVFLYRTKQILYIIYFINKKMLLNEI
jgi:hypothetical protein